MNFYVFEVTYDQRQWQQVGMEMENRGTRRNTMSFTVVAESLAFAEAEVVNNKNFYTHQNPQVVLISQTRVNQLVLVRRIP